MFSTKNNYIYLILISKKSTSFDLNISENILSLTLDFIIDHILNENDVCDFSNCKGND